MTNGNQSLDMTETAAALDNNHRMAAYDKFQHDLLFNAFEYTSPSIRKRIKFLRELQSKYDELEARFLEEKAALEAKYQKFYQPFYDKRYEIVNGHVEVDGVSIKDVEAEDDCEKGIPNFWLTAMKNNEDIVDEIFEKDEGALGYLNNIKWSKTDHPNKGFKLDFFFNTNPYFKNSVLTKIYHMIDEQEPILEMATGTEVEWYPGKCLTLNIKNEGNMLGKLKDRESFFDFFNPPPIPARRSDIDDDTADKLKQQMERDYDVGITIRDKIIPHAISWFTGEVRGISYNPDDSDDDDDECENEGYFSEDYDQHEDKN